MKSFFKYVLATIVGTLIVGIIFFFISMGIISAFVSIATKEKVIQIKDNSVLYLTLDKPILDRKPVLPLFNFNLPSLKPQPIIGLTELINNIDKAKEDPKIEGIYLELTNLAAGVATVDEIRNALLDFKESGKFVICYSNLYTQSTYYLGSVADEVYLNPEGMIYIWGVGRYPSSSKGA